MTKPKSPAAKKPAKKKTESEPTAAAYTAQLTVGGVKYEGSGATIFDALKAIAATEAKLTTKGVLVISNGIKSADFLLYAGRLRPLFFKKNDTAKVVFAKWAALRLQ